MSAPATATLAVHVRYFAAAAEAAGASAEQLTLPVGAGLADLRAALTGHHPAAARVLAISSFLVDDVVRADDDAPLTDAAAVRVDVLPPFAGG